MEERAETPLRVPLPRPKGLLTATCRVAAHRARRATALIRTELQAASATHEPVVHAGRPPWTSADEQVARAFVEAKSLAGIFARLGSEARPGLA